MNGKVESIQVTNS